MSETGVTREKLKSYEVSGQIYKFPAAGKIEKEPDTSGILDQWPAYSSKRYISSNQLIMTKSKSLMVVDEKYTKLPNLTPKPKFLQYLEEYLSKELKKHNAEEIGSSDIRLDIYREVFDYLLEAFTTYRPLLAEVKREYEETISKLRQEIRDLEPMKEIIWTISEERNKEMLQIKQQEKEEITIIKHEKLQLSRQISELEANQMTLEIQIEKLKSSLSEQYLAYRNEADARKLLIIDINDMRQQIEDLNNLQRNTETESKDDPVVLRIGLEEAKKSHTKLLTQITRMETDYANVVPKRDFEMLTKEHQKLTTESSDIHQRFSQMQLNNEALEEKFTALQQQRDFYYVKYMDLAKSSTPRPDWKKCGESVSGGPTWWQEQSKDKSSKALVDLLLQELTMSSSVKESVEAKGLDTSVLGFLRTEGKVNLRFMPKRDVKIHIREIWTGRKLLKEEHLESLQNNKEYKLPPLDDYVDLFFRKTYGIEQIRLEWAYSFNECLDKEQNDDSIIQFRRILNKEMDEAVYWQEMSFYNNILDKCKSKDTDKNNMISRDDLKDILENMYVKKLDETEVKNLIDITMADFPPPLPTPDGEVQLEPKEVAPVFIPYNDLFLSNDEGKYGPFLEAVKKSYDADKKAYIVEIEKELRDVGTKINCSQLKDSIQIVDPEIPQNLLNQYICWCFSCTSIDNAEKSDSMSVEDLVNRLVMGSVRRISLRS